MDKHSTVDTAAEGQVRNASPKTWVANTALVLASLLISALVGEAMIRLIDDKPIFVWRNWLDEHLVHENLSQVVQYDPNVGWRLKADLRTAGMNTSVQGLRFTTDVPPQIVPDGIVAVGDSFTAGSEVGDTESWPAFLEQSLGRAVYNGGVGGWGTDQILLRGEELIDFLDPEILVVDFLASDIERSGFRVYGRGGKPYFRVEDGMLVRYNDPVPMPSEYRSGLAWFNAQLHHSYLYFRTASSISAGTIAMSDSDLYQTVDNDPVAVTCKLLQRVKSKADRQDVRMILVMQYGGDIIREFALPPVHSRAVIACALDLGIQVVDEFPTLRRIALQSIDELKRHYVMHNDDTVYGHMSAIGNRHVAELIAAAIRSPDDHFVAQTYYDAQNDKLGRFSLGSGQAIFHEDEDLTGRVGLAYAELVAERGSGEGRTYRLIAEGEKSEHYLATGLLDSKPGLHVFSVWLDAATTRLAALQLQDRDGRGAIIMIHLPTSSLEILKLKNASVDAWIAEERDDWVRVAVSLHAVSPAVQGILQHVGRNWSRNFEPNGEVIRFTGMRLERLPNSDS